MNAKETGSQKTKTDQIVDVLRDIILAGDLGPGERLLQEELAKRFDVSPTPIREAIKQLVAEGVLSHSPYKGVHVAEVNLEDAHEIYLIRAVVEELATKLAVPRLRIMDIKQLHAYHQTICDHLEAGERKAIRKVNYNFHILIYETANMPELLRIIRGLWMKSPLDSLYVIPRRAQQAIDEHQAILDAIDDGDADRAGAGMRIHIENGWKTLTTYLEENQ